MKEKKMFGNNCINSVIILLILLTTCIDGHAFKQLNGCGVWAESDLPIKYVIDSEAFDSDQVAAIRRAFNTWSIIYGSKLKFQEISYTGQSLSNNPEQDSNPIFIITRKDIEDVPEWYKSKLEQNNGGAASYPLCDNSQNNRIIFGSIIFKTRPDLLTLWSTSDHPILPSKDVESVALHEIGHSIGLAHPKEPPDAARVEKTVMGAIGDNILERSLYPDDKAAAIALYPSYNPTIYQSPSSGIAGVVEFTQWGSGFTQNSTANLHVQKPDKTEYDVQDVSINRSGEFAIPYKPNADKAPGTYTWWVVDKYGAESNKLSYEILNYTLSPTIAQTPMKSTPGTTFAQWGTGFTPNSTATLHFRKPDLSEYPTLKQPLDSIGHFDIRWTAPVDKPPGAYTWWAIDDSSGIGSNPVTYEITSRSPAVYNFWRTPDPMYGDPDSDDDHPNFNAGYSIKNDGKQQIIIETLALAIHHADNQYAWDMKIPGTGTQRYYYNITLNPGETKTFETSSCYFKDTDIGNYLVVAKAQIAGEWRELKYLNFTVRGNSSGEDTYLKITSPNGGESWQQGSNHSITWSKSGTVGSEVKIELYKGGSLYSTITSATDNDGTRHWDIPSDLPPDSDYKIRITSLAYPSLYDLSNGNFTIRKIPNGGAIFGRVTDSEGTGIPNVQAIIVTQGNAWAAQTTTDANGYYFADGLATGNYKVRFDGKNLDYRITWYNGKGDFSSADTVAVTSPNETGGINAVLEQGGAISGRVTDTSGNGLQNIWVTLDDQGLLSALTDG